MRISDGCTLISSSRKFTSHSADFQNALIYIFMHNKSTQLERFATWAFRMEHYSSVMEFLEMDFTDGYSL